MLECPRCYCELDWFSKYGDTFCSVCDREYHFSDFEPVYLKSVRMAMKEHNESLRCDDV